MLKRILSLLVSVFVCLPALSQTIKVWSLEDCIRYAEEHSISIQKQALATNRSRLALQEARWSFVPSLSVSSTFTSSTGRVLDPTTYQFVETKFTSNNSSSVSGDIAIFEGGKKIHMLNKMKLSLEAESVKEMSIEYSLRLNVIAAYMDLLCSGEQIKVAKESVSLIEEQMERSLNLLDAGNITESEALQFKSQLFAARNDEYMARHNEEQARLTLCDLLEIEDSVSFMIAEPSPEKEYMWISDLESAIDNHPDYKSSVISQRIMETDYSIAKAAMYPTLSLSAGYGSSFSDARKKAIQSADGTISYEAYPFFGQYTDNASAYVSLGIRIPIFNGFSSTNNIKRAKIAIAESQLATAEVRKQLRKQIIQAQIDCEAARNKYLLKQEEAHYADEARRQMNEKYNVGLTDYYGWYSALVESVKAKYSLIESKYEYFFKCETLKVYYP